MVYVFLIYLSVSGLSFSKLSFLYNHYLWKYYLWKIRNSLKIIFLQYYTRNRLDLDTLILCFIFKKLKSEISLYYTVQITHATILLNNDNNSNI